MTDTRNEIEINRGKVADKNGKELHYRVYKRSFKSKDGRPFSFLSFEIFEVVKFVRKTDSRDGTKKVGETDFFKNYKISTGRMKDLLVILRDIDRQFNESRGFGNPVERQSQQDFIDDEMPF